MNSYDKNKARKMAAKAIEMIDQFGDNEDEFMLAVMDELDFDPYMKNLMIWVKVVDPIINEWFKRTEI